MLTVLRTCSRLHFVSVRPMPTSPGRCGPSRLTSLGRERARISWTLASKLATSPQYSLCWHEKKLHPSTQLAIIRYPVKVINYNHTKQRNKIPETPVRGSMMSGFGMIRVYIAITFTTLIDRFTSLRHKTQFRL